MRRPALALVALAVVLLSASVLPVLAQDKPRSGGELVFVVPSEPPSYDAHQEETLRAFEAKDSQEAARIAGSFLQQMKDSLGSRLLPVKKP